MKKTYCLTFAALLLIAGPSIAGWDPADHKKPSISKEMKVDKTITMFKDKDPDLKRFFDKAYGYAVFPTVGKGAIGIGAAYGKGIVYEKGKAIGSVSLKQLSYGFQLGGQAYSELIFFKDKTALKTFEDGNFEFGAGVSAVALKAGASADTDYSKGVAVFTMTKGGLMYEASISGQKFNYTPYR